MSRNFTFPPAPEGHYFQIKNGLEDHLDAPRWRVVLIRKRWIFPYEVAGAELEHLTQDAVTEAANQAHMNLSALRVVRAIEKTRKQLNRAARKNKRKIRP